MKKLYEYKGESKSLKEWAKEYGLPEMTVWSRVNRYGRTLEEALTMRKVRRGDFSGMRRLAGKALGTGDAT